MKSSPSLRDSLRAGTAESHKNVDRVFSAFDLANRDDYALFLAAQASALFAIEAELERAGIATAVSDWQERRRSDDMREDLALFAVEPECVESPSLTSVDEMLAALYVLEGSRLGGRILVKQALASVDDRVRDATTFLRHGAGQRLWQSFMGRLDEHAQTNPDIDVMIATARGVFDVFQRAAVSASARRVSADQATGHSPVGQRATASEAHP